MKNPKLTFNFLYLKNKNKTKLKFLLVVKPVKEEQMSEAWSLDADPPESVINEPLIDDANPTSNVYNSFQHQVC